NRRTGQPVGMPFGYIADGIIQTQAEAESAASIAGYTLRPGDLKYRDLNNDGTINQFDQAPIGTTKPLLYYGLTAGFSFKGFDVSILFQGVENRVLYMPDYTRHAFGTNGTSQAYPGIVGRWMPENGSTATYPTLTPGVNINNDPSGLNNQSTFWAQPGDYFR